MTKNTNKIFTSIETTTNISLLPKEKPTGFIHLSLFIIGIWIIYKIFSSQHFRIKTPAFELERTAQPIKQKPIKKDNAKKVTNVRRKK